MRIFPKEAESIECDEDAKYRTINGTCNNLKNPEFGSINTKFERLIPADYGDCISTLRESVTGHPLPNTREVSFKVHGSNADRLNPNSRVLSHLAMNFGQFMDHDLSLAEAQGVNCEPPEDEEEPECINIHIPEEDKIFLDRNITFIEMEREAFIEPDSFCQLRVREHPNTITAYIDASNVYGSTDEIAEDLRAADGLLLVMKHPHGCQFKNLLPAQVDGFCPTRNFFEPCFFSGDIRNNENPGKIGGAIHINSSLRGPWVSETFLARIPLSGFAARGFGFRPKTCRPAADPETSPLLLIIVRKKKPLIPRVSSCHETLFL